MFDANNISVRSYVRHVRLKCLQLAPKLLHRHSDTQYNLRIFKRI